MVDLKSMSNEEILKRKDFYVKRLEHLKEEISMYLSGEHKELGECIKEEYTALKREIREEANYLKKRDNNILNVSQEHNGYAWGIREASAYGFTVRINSPINQKMYNSVAEARYRINKCFE